MYSIALTILSVGQRVSVRSGTASSVQDNKADYALEIDELTRTHGDRMNINQDYRAHAVRGVKFATKCSF
jgi:hypothetical protein